MTNISEDNAPQNQIGRTEEQQVTVAVVPKHGSIEIFF